MSRHDCSQLSSMSGDLSGQQQQQQQQQLQKVTVAYTNQPCRRKLQFINGKFAVQKPQTCTVQKRNERERNRVKLINRTFSTLRDCLPPKYAGKKAKKLSKVDVLKTATAYIAYLARLLDEDTCSRQQQQQQQIVSQPQPYMTYPRQEASASQSADTSGIVSIDYQHQQLQQQLTSSLGVYCDLSALLDDSSVPQQQQQQRQQHPQAVQQPVSDGSTKEGDIEVESGIFQLSSEAESSSSSPWLMQQLLPIVPPAPTVSCFTFSTPIKPTDGVEVALCFTAGVASNVTDGGQELQVLSMSDISEGCSYLQYI